MTLNREIGVEGGGGSITGEDHSELSNLDYTGSGHTGFRPQDSGFVTKRTGSTIFFDNDGSIGHQTTPRTFYIYGNYSFHVQTSNFTKNTAIDAAEYIQISNTTGIHWIYYDANGQLQEYTTIPADYDFLYGQVCLVASIYWNASDSLALYVGDERHGTDYTWEMHKYEHIFEHTKWRSGLAIVPASVDGTGDDAADAEIDFGDGSIADEDLYISIADDTPQDLSPVGQIPIFYREGATAWRMKPADDYPVIYSDGVVFTGADDRLPWNQNVAGTWQLTEVTPDGDLVLVHYLATNDIAHPIIGIQGQAEYNNLAAARDGAIEELGNLVLAGLPFEEFRFIATAIFQTSTPAYANTPHARIRSTDTGATHIDWRSQAPTPSGIATDHAQLANLDFVSSGHTGFGVISTWQNVLDNFLPTDLGSALKAWWRSDLGVTLAAGEVQTWADQSGNGHDWTKLAGTNGPTIQAASLNGHDTLKFVGSSSQFLKNATMGALFSGYQRPFMVFFVCKQSGGGNQNIWYQQDGTYYHELIYFSGNAYYRNQLYLNASIGTRYVAWNATGGWQLGCFYSDKSTATKASARESSRIRAEDLDIAMGGVARTLTYGTLGCYASGAAYGSRGYFLTGEIAEIIFLDSPLEESMILLVEQYLSRRYGLVGYTGTINQVSTPIGTVLSLNSGPYTIRDYDHHIVVRTDSAAIELLLPTIDATVVQREYIITRDVQAAPASTHAVTITAAGTQTIKYPDGGSATSITLTRSQESVTLKGAVNFGVAPYYFWQVVATTAPTAQSLGTLTNALTEKTTPVDADMVPLMDSASGNIWKKLSWSNIKAKILSYLVPTYTRTKLSTDTTYYVRTDGSDSNDGSANDAAHAWLTPQHAMDYLKQNLDAAGHNIVIQLGDGTYSGNYPLTITDIQINAKKITIQGNSSTPTSVIISGTQDAIAIFGYAQVGADGSTDPAETGLLHIKDLKVSSTNRNGLYVENSWVAISGVDFGTCGGHHMRICRNGLVTMIGSYTISGDATSHLDCEYGGTFCYDDHAGAMTVTATGTRAFTQFALAANAGWIISSSSITFSGTFTGKRFTIKTDGIIDTAGVGLEHFPGDAAGTIEGGSYDGVKDPILNVTFNAGDFTANGSMTWTVESGDVTAFKYCIVGKQMTVWLTIATTSIGGTLNNTLYIKIPAGKTAAATTTGVIVISDPGAGGQQFARIISVSGDTNLWIRKVPTANFGANTDAFYADVFFIFEIQ